MLRDRRKSLTLERRSPPPDQARLQRGGERRGSFAAPSNSLLQPPAEPRHHERRGSLVTRWFKHISEAAEAYKQRDGRNRRADAAAAAAAAAQQDLDDHSHDKTKDMEDGAGDLLSPPRATNGHGHGDESPSPNSDVATPLLPPSGDASPSPSTASATQPDTPTKWVAKRMGDSLSPSPSLSRKVAEPLRLTTAESSLIQPSEVLISQRPVLTAEPVLTPLEKLRRKDEAIKVALAEKQQLVADILHVPKDEFDTIAEIAGEPATEKEASELILAAVNQANQLSAMVNEALRVSEEDAVSAGVTSRGGAASKGATAGVPAHKLNAIATSLNAQLTQLLSVLVQRDDERERLRRELQRSREQLHALHEHRGLSDEQQQQQQNSESGSAAPVEQPGQESSQESASPVTTESTPVTTTAQEVFVDALSGEAESHLEAAAAAEAEGGEAAVAADSVD
ncbi:hypothetical protein LSTR_LSTR002665 [Laodelphax striatellus]|uniref:Uncharacterized protein n=1 Tax=Laodelphax striatellus TaxID=195883 RepID=A0A482X5M8_LAOST|nr:hypothetical protein LSTR_LSTR002665 [Laodelphax striatellus]